MPLMAAQQEARQPAREQFDLMLGGRLVRLVAARLRRRGRTGQAGRAAPLAEVVGFGIDRAQAHALVEQVVDLREGRVVLFLATLVVVALVVGKAVGITGASLLVTRLPGIRLDPTLRWPDVVGLSFVAGIGFTVSLLVGELAYGTGSAQDDVVKVGVLVGSLISAVVGGTILAVRGRRLPAEARPEAG